LHGIATGNNLHDVATGIFCTELSREYFARRCHGRKSHDLPLLHETFIIATMFATVFTAMFAVTTAIVLANIFASSIMPFISPNCPFIHHSFYSSFL